MKTILYLITILVFFSCCSKTEIVKQKNAGDFPILAWVGVPEEETTEERYTELKESGININFTWYSDIEAVEKALDIAGKTGIKLLPSCPELKDEPEKTAERLMKHPALAGYHLQDEPSAADFAELAEWTKRIQSVDSVHGCYINLFPNYAFADQLFGEGLEFDKQKDAYKQYVEKFIKDIPVPFISFDHYPVLETDGIRSLRPEWYKNLEIVAEVSKNSGLPVWAFALSVAHKPYPVPTLAELRLQMFSNLAYGAQVLQYFTYWQPRSTIWDFHDSPINLDGERTIVYELVKTVNREINSLAHVFLNSELISVWHTGKNIPEGTKPLKELPKQIKSLETSGDGAVVSLLEKEKKQYLVIVNRDFQNLMELKITTDNTVKKVLKSRTLTKIANNTESIFIEPGDIAIYTWNI